MRLRNFALRLVMTAGMVAGPVAAQQAEPGNNAARQSITGGELNAMDVVNGEGQTIGDVDRVVRDKADNALYVVIEVGGFLGFGATRVLVPLNQAQLTGSDLLVPLANTEDELKARPEYREAMYIEVSDNETVRVGPAGEPMGIGVAGSAAEPNGAESAAQRKRAAERDADASNPPAVVGAPERNREGYLGRDTTGGDENRMRNSEAIDRRTGEPRDSTDFSAFEGDARSDGDTTMQPKPMDQVSPTQPMGPAGGERPGQ